jgi:hypothetical protein
VALRYAAVLLAAAVLASVGAFSSSAVEAKPPTQPGPCRTGTSGTVSGELKKWQPIALSFTGPSASETTASPNNPFLDYRLQVTFTGPSSQIYTVPGFFDGDGKGGASGDVWRVRFSPPRPAPGAIRPPSAKAPTSPSIRAPRPVPPPASTAPLVPSWSPIATQPRPGS